VLSGRRAWVFDLDGTLALAQHDFDAMKSRLGLDASLPLLEAANALDEPARSEAWAAISAWELELADRATPQVGLHTLLDGLAGRGARMGVLTRNRKDVALRTLQAVGGAHHFHEADVLGRDCASPKPDPEGLLRLLDGWSVSTATAVMVGDSIHDIATARAAGVPGVLVGPGTEAARGLADLVVDDLAALWRLVV